MPHFSAEVASATRPSAHGPGQFAATPTAPSPFNSTSVPTLLITINSGTTAPRTDSNLDAYLKITLTTTQNSASSWAPIFCCESPECAHGGCAADAPPSGER